MTGGLEWRDACRHLRPRQIRTGIGSTAEPDSRLGLGASTSTRDVGMPFAVMCPFPTSTFSLVNINALGVQSTRPPLIHRAPHTSHSGFHVYCMAQALGERRQVVQGDRAECDGVKRHRLLPSMVFGQQVPRVRHSAFLNPFAATMAGSLRSLVPLQCASLWQHEPTGAGCA